MRLPEGRFSPSSDFRSKGKLVAYLDPSPVFWQAGALAVPMPDDFAPAPVEGNSFQPTEWAVIALARHDSMATLSEPRQSRLGRVLFGQPRIYRLSGERLEALRWLAVEAWHQPLAISLRALGGFVAAGFTSTQLSLLLATTGALRAMANQNVLSAVAAGNSL